MVGSHPRLPVPPQAHCATMTFAAGVSQAFDALMTIVQEIMNEEKTLDQSQYARFVETARALGCDESEATFDEKVKVVIRLKAAAKLKTGKAPSGE